MKAYGLTRARDWIQHFGMLKEKTWMYSRWQFDPAMKYAQIFVDLNIFTSNAGSRVKKHWLVLSTTAPWDLTARSCSSWKDPQIQTMSRWLLSFEDWFLAGAPFMWQVEMCMQANG